MDSEQDLRFFQDRLALYGKTVFWLSTMFLVVGFIADLVARTLPEANRVSEWAHTAATLIAFVLWRVNGSRRLLTERALNAWDWAGTMAMCLSFTAMGCLLPQPWGSHTALLACTHVIIGRAVIVPSNPRRTLVIASLSFTAMVISRAFLPLPAILPHTTAVWVRGVLDALLWSAAAVASATVASKVIYGLQEKALEARQLGQYTLEEKIGEGGMGEIYRARHAMLRRPTAIKLMTGDGSEDQLRRFEREVQLTAQLTHPNTISIYDYGRTPDGRFYYAMELLDGMTLEQLVTRCGPQSPARVLHIMLQICGALREAHSVGLIHRDIKPANIYLCPRGGIRDVVKVLDFGLVRQIRDDGSVTRSNINAIVGTPLYLSPEAILAPDRIDARADLYALGVVAYFLLTGAPLFTGDSVVEVCAHHLHTDPPPPSARAPRTIPADLERAVLSCLAKDAADRPQSAQILAKALRACRDAGAWTESDAELWWTKLEEGSAPNATDQASAVVELGTTVCCADLHERLGRAAHRRRK